MSLKLRNNQQFRKVYDQGQRFHTPLFSMFILKNEINECRFGITVTKKIGTAVARNRCKRRLKEVIKRYYTKPKAEGLKAVGYDLVINAKQELLTADFKQIEESFSSVLERFCRSQEI